VSSVRLASLSDIESVQRVFNARTSVKLVGTWTHATEITNRVSKSKTLAYECDGEIVGASEIGYSNPNRMKMDLVAVNQEYRRQRIASTLYATWALLGACRGSLLQVDTVVDTNPLMEYFLPSMGFEKTAVLRSRVRRHHSIHLWYGKISTERLEQLVQKIPKCNTLDSSVQELSNSEKFQQNYQLTIKLLHDRGWDKRREEVQSAYRFARNYLQLEHIL